MHKITFVVQLTFSCFSFLLLRQNYSKLLTSHPILIWVDILIISISQMRKLRHKKIVCCLIIVRGRRRKRTQADGLLNSCSYPQQWMGSHISSDARHGCKWMLIPRVFLYLVHRCQKNTYFNFALVFTLSTFYNALSMFYFYLNF